MDDANAVKTTDHRLCRRMCRDYLFRGNNASKVARAHAHTLSHSLTRTRSLASQSVSYVCPRQRAADRRATAAPWHRTGSVGDRSARAWPGHTTASLGALTLASVPMCACVRLPCGSCAWGTATPATWRGVVLMMGRETDAEHVEQRAAGRAHLDLSAPGCVLARPAVEHVCGGARRMRHADVTCVGRTTPTLSSIRPWRRSCRSSRSRRLRPLPSSSLSPLAPRFSAWPERLGRGGRRLKRRCDTGQGHLDQLLRVVPPDDAHFAKAQVLSCSSFLLGLVFGCRMRKGGAIAHGRNRAMMRRQVCTRAQRGVRIVAAHGTRRKACPHFRLNVRVSMFVALSRVCAHTCARARARENSTC